MSAAARETWNLVREVRWPAGMRRGQEVYVTRQVGIREEAVSEDECRECWGTGRAIHGWRSWNCERGDHTTTCIGNTDPRQCICFCHQEVADKRRELTSGAPA